MHFPGNFFGLVESLLQLPGKVHLPGTGAGNLRQPFYGGGQLLPQGGGVNADLLHQLRDEPLLLLQQAQQQVLLPDLLILTLSGQLLGGLDGFYAFLGELIEVHKTSSSHWFFMGYTAIFRRS